MKRSDIIPPCSAGVADCSITESPVYTPVVKIVPIFDEDGTIIGEAPAHIICKHGLPPVNAIDTPDLVNMSDPVVRAAIAENTNNIGELPMSMSPMEITDTARSFVESTKLN